MSKISLKSSSSGTATFTIESPATNTDRTLVLPDVAGTVALTSQIPAAYTDTDALDLFNASGSAPVFACRAFVNFNSTGTVAIRGSGNCSSITDNGVGNFTFNFATAMPDINYCVTTGPTQSSSNNNGGVINVFLSATNTVSDPLVSSFRFVNYHAINSALGDSDYNCLSVFR